ncbi:hypothetical protein N752_19205 [Desulforamulus aquiferis]|nr:hypothetical protein N752_19205 [Desulforamulus aquiferis]
MKNCLATIPWRFSTERMVKEYTRRFYLPAALKGRLYAAEGFRLAREMQEHKGFIRCNWHQVYFKGQRVEQLRN